MPHIAFWFHHASDDPERIAELLCLPALSDLTRTAMVDRDRRTGHTAKTKAAIVEQLRSPKSQGVELDGGRGRDLDEKVFIIFDRARDAYPVPHWGYIVLKYESSRLDDYLGSFSRMATQLDTSLAYMSLEPSFSEAQSVALGYESRETRARKDMTDRRRRERKAQKFYIREIGRRLPAVHWGMYLSSGYLEAVELAQLKESPAFYLVRELEGGIAYLQLTADPEDALGESYEETLDKARSALAPILIDLSDIELKQTDDQL